MVPKLRVKSAIYISALTRRLFSDGLAGAIEKKGAEDAGAIFIRVLKRDRSQMLLSPAPQSLTQGETADRCFEIRLENATESEVDQKLAREKSFDSDIWIAEIETDDPERYLKIL